MTTTELPEAPVFTIPEPDHNDPAHLYAWYGPFGVAQDYRKVVLSGAEEVVRADYAARNEKITEQRLDALAHLHDAYLGFLERTLYGRIAYEREAAKRGIGG